MYIYNHRDYRDETGMINGIEVEIDRDYHLVNVYMDIMDPGFPGFKVLMRIAWRTKENWMDLGG